MMRFALNHGTPGVEILAPVAELFSQVGQVVDTISLAQVLAQVREVDSAF